MAVIRVPKTPKSAFDRNRKPSQLLKDQVTHFEWAVRPASERHPKDFRPIPPRTEGGVAARIEKLTRQLLERTAAGNAIAALPPAVAPPAAPSGPPAGERRRVSGAKPAHPPRASVRRKPRTRKRR